MLNFMKNFVLCLSIYAMGSSMAVACEISGRGLSEEMRQQLIVSCEKMKLDASTNPVPKVSAQEVTEWAKISQEFAKAIGIAAKELGVAVNDFVTTPAGVVTVGVILWHTVGSDIVRLLSIILVSGFVYIFNTYLWYGEKEKFKRKFGPFEWESCRGRRTPFRDMNEGSVILSVLSLLMLVLYTSVVIAHL